MVKKLLEYFNNKTCKKQINLTVCYYHVISELQNESTLYSCPECQGTPCLKQAPYLEFKWQQRDSNPQPLLLNGWVFVYKLGGCGFKSRYCHLNKSEFKIDQMIMERSDKLHVKRKGYDSSFSSRNNANDIVK